MPTSYPIPRRQFVAAAAGLLVTRPGAGTPTLPAGLFTLGVASGDPGPDGVVLWTRLAPDPVHGGGMPARRVPVDFEVATDRRFRHVRARGVSTARPALAHSVHVEVHGLEPDREYFYRFRAGREVSPVDRTRTAPARLLADLRVVNSVWQEDATTIRTGATFVVEAGRHPVDDDQP
jgi:alkaline phosphatase D